MTNRIKKWLVAITLLLSSASPSWGNEITAEVGIESQYFINPAMYPEQERHNASVSLDIEYYTDWDDGNKRFLVSGFGRFDGSDSERSHTDIRELYYWQALENDMEFYAGFRHVFWGVTETRHLVDIVNQTDFVENIDGEDKLGQPMLSLLMDREWGSLEMFALLGFRERTFTGPDGRLRGPLPINNDVALYQSSDEDEHIDWAVRWSHVVGDWDIGVSHFSGTARDPIFVPELAEQSQAITGLTPYYSQIKQTGLDVQATKESTLWKLEAISVEYQGSGRHTALVGGFEHTLYGIAGSDIDLGLLMEYQFDDRTGIYQTSSQNDLALGMRYAFNDVEGTEVLAAMSVDLDNQSRFISVEASRRLNDHWSFSAEARFFSNMDNKDPGYVLREDDYLQLEFRRFF